MRCPRTFGRKEKTVFRTRAFLLLIAIAFPGAVAAGEIGSGHMPPVGTKKTDRRPLFPRPAAAGSANRVLREAAANIPAEVRTEFQRRYAAYARARLAVGRLSFLERASPTMNMAARRSEYRTLVDEMPSHRELLAMGLEILPLVLTLPEEERAQAGFLFLDLLETVHPRFGAVLAAPMQAVEEYSAFWVRNREYIAELDALAVPESVSAEEVDKNVVWPAQMVFEARMPECSVS